MFFSLFLTLILSTPLFSQSPPLYFEKVLGQEGQDLFENVQVTADGGYILTGGVEVGEPLLEKLWVLRLDSEGTQVFEKNFGRHSGNRGFCIRETQNGGYVVAGQTSVLTRFKSRFGAPTYHHRALLLRLDAEGNLDFEKTWGNGRYDQAHWVEETADLGFLVAGTIREHPYLGRFDAKGDRVWEKTLGDQSGRGLCLAELPSHRIMVVGALGEKTREVAWMKAFDPQGKPLFERRFNPGLSAVARSVIAVEEVLFVTGYYQGRNQSSRAFVLKLDRDGKLLKEFSARSGTEAWGIAKRGSQYLLAGTLDQDGQQDAWFLVLDSDLQPRDEKIYGGTGWDSIHSLGITTQGEILLAGLTRSKGAAISSALGEEPDAWILKLDTQGRTRELWVEEEFKKTKKLGKIKAYRQFLQEFPGSRFGKEAQGYIQRESEYKDALRTGTVGTMEAFLKKYPRTRHRDFLLARLLEFYRAQDLIPGYLNFIKKFPANIFSTQALRTLYGRAFERARSSYGFKALAEYQKIFRYSPYFWEAEALIYSRELQDMRERVIKQGGKLAFERIAAMKSQEALRALQAKRFWIANRKYSLIFENPPFSKTSIARNRIHNERFARIRPYLKDGKQQRLWGVQGFEKLLAAEPKKQGNWLRSEDLKGLLQLHFEFLETGDLLAFKTPGQKARIQYSLFMTPKDQDHCRRAPRWLCFD